METNCRTSSTAMHVGGSCGFMLLVMTSFARGGTNDSESSLTMGPSFDVEVKITASDAAAGDRFGFAVSISGDTAIVGAYLDGDSGPESGSAYVFQRDQGGAGNWGEVAKLTADDAAAGDRFGLSISIDGNTAIVGAYFDDDAGSGSGSAYIFQRDEGGLDNWGQVTKLTAGDAASLDWFGWSVSLSGDTAVVSAVIDDDAGPSSGSAYVFQRDAGGTDNWGEVKKLVASDGAESDQFGSSVSISGDVVIVGANGDADAGPASGSAYVFARHQGGADNWGEVAKLTASDAAADDGFGNAVAISGETAIIGAPRDDDGGGLSGSAYVFQRDQGGPDNWGEVTKLTAGDAASFDLFGGSVTISGDTAVVGATWDDDVGQNSGSAYVFQRDQGGADNWGEVTKLNAEDGAFQDEFGTSTSISGGAVIVGANFDDDSGPDSGSAYLFIGQVSVSLGDCDGDGDVDLEDFSSFQGCFTGPDGDPIDPKCGCSDFDTNGLVDLSDWAALQTVFTGSGP